jgi:hypothetical protein
MALCVGLVAAAAPCAFAAQTDLQPLRSIVNRAPGCTQPPNSVSPICLKVVVRNHGPDAYVGTPGKAGGGGGPGITAGQLRVTVDIDEPTKPGNFLPPSIQATFTRDFVVTIAAGDSATLDFGPIPFKPQSSVHHVTATTQAQMPNIDPNPANDSVTTLFTVNSVVPAAGWVGLVAAGTVLALWAVWQARRRRVLARR